MAKQLYDYWFVQFDFPNEEGKPYKSSGGAMVWNDKLKREIPSCFEVVNLGNLCDFRNGINYSKDETGNNYQIVNVRNISSSRILLDGEDFDVITVPTSKAENYVLKPDDIIIARSGCPGSTRLLLSPANTLFCGFIICCSPNDSSMRNYLVYCLKQLEGTNATTSGGSILQNISQDTLKGLHIIVPEKQIIDNFNKTIELIFARMLNCLKESKALTKLRDELLPLLMNGQALVNDNLEAMAKQLYDYWFVQFDFPNEEGKPYKSSGGAMVWNEKLKREIPQGWSDCILGDICDMYQPKTLGLNDLSEDSEYKVYGANGIIGHYSSYNHENSEIAMACRGNSCGTINRTSPKSWITGNAMVIKFRNKEIHSEYIKQALKYANVKGAISGSGQPQLTRENLSLLKMTQPNYAILEAFSKKVAAIVAMELEIEEQNDNLTKQRDELLPLLMNGQASVNYHLSAC